MCVSAYASVCVCACVGFVHACVGQCERALICGPSERRYVGQVHWWCMSVSVIVYASMHGQCVGTSATMC